eukprot:Awhi_evm1s7961
MNMRIPQNGRKGTTLIRGPTTSITTTTKTNNAKANIGKKIDDLIATFALDEKPVSFSKWSKDELTGLTDKDLLNLGFEKSDHRLQILEMVV